MKKNIIIVSAIVLIAIIIKFAFASVSQIIQANMMKKGSIPSVTVSEVNEEKVIKEFEAPGRILSQYRVDIVARIEGYLTKSYFKEGDYVKKNQVLFEIEPQEWLFNVQKVQANIKNTQAQLVYAEKQVKRGAVLVQKDYIAKAEYDELVSKRDALKGQLAMYQAEFRDANRNYSYTKVKAPVDGQVGMINVTVGNYVNASVGNLTTIYSNNPIYVTFPIDSKAYLTLTKNESANLKRKVELTFPSGEKYEQEGIQDFSDNTIDESTGTITLRATFANPENRLIHGEYVKIKMYASVPTDMPVVPQTAVMENPQGKYVYTLENENIPKITMIKTSGQIGNNWIIESGLQKGDKIITGGLQKVIPDVAVKVETNESK